MPSSICVLAMAMRRDLERRIAGIGALAFMHGVDQGIGRRLQLGDPGELGVGQRFAADGIDRHGELGDGVTRAHLRPP